MAATEFDYTLHVNWPLTGGVMALSTSCKIQVPIALTIKYVMFHNTNAGSAFTAAATVTNAAAAVVSSTATLAADTTEVFSGVALGNVDVAADDDIEITAGDQTTLITIFCYATYTA